MSALHATIDHSDERALAREVLAAAPPRPRLRAIVARTAASVTVACVAPAVLFWAVLTSLGISAGLIVALAWALGVICWRSATRRRPSGLLALALAVMVVRTGFALATGNTFVYFIQPVFADAAVAIAFLASLLTARPAVARLAGDFYPMDDELAARPRVRRLFRRLTLMWGLVIIAKGSITLWLLESQSTVDFVALKTAAVVALTGTAAATTVWVAAVVARKEGMLAAP
jgi:intracellular septation protein A